MFIGLSSGVRGVFACACVSWTASAAAALQVTKVEVTLTGPHLDETVNVRASVSSEFSVQKVTVSVAGLTGDLACCTAGSWAAGLSARTLTFGTYPVTVTATDVYGATATGTGVLNVDRLPQLTVDTVPEGSVVRPNVRVRVRCVDDGPKGCTSLFVQSAGHPKGAYELGRFVPDASGVIDVDTVFSLAADDGFERKLEVFAEDSTGRSVAFQRRVVVERSPRLREVRSVLGRILASDDRRAVYVDGSDRLWLKDGDAAPVLLKDAPAGARDEAWPPFRAFLCGEGVVFGRDDYEWRPPSWFEWRDGRVTVLDTVDRIRAQRGPWLFYGVRRTDLTGPQIQRLRNMDTGVERTRPEPLYLSRVALEANGTLTYVRRSADGSRFQLVRWRGDADTEEVLQDPAIGTRNVWTDGVLVAFDYYAYWGEGPVRTEPYDLYVHGPGGVTRLTEDLRFGGSAALHDGWLAYTRTLDGASGVNAWLRSPDGGTRQMTYYNDAVFVEALGPNQEVLVERDRRRLLARGLELPLDVSSALGEPEPLADGGIRVVLGNTIFQLDLGPDAGPLLDEPPLPQAADAGPADAGPADAGDAGAAPEPPAEEPQGCTQAGGGVLAWFAALCALLLIRRASARTGAAPRR